MARVEVISGSERRRRWSDEQKQAIVAEASAPGAMISEIARRADICPGQIYRWRQEIGAVGGGFAEVLIGPDDHREPVPAIKVEFAGKARVRIPAGVPAELAAAVIKALSRR